MASDRQVAANRRNAARSTGPRTARGKLRSRRNACRHGLTAETVVASPEDPAEYQRFEAGLYDDYAPQGAVEQQLVARLSSLLWRVRRATLIETGLFEMQGGVLLQQHRDQLNHQADNPSLDVFYRLLHEPQLPTLDALTAAADQPTDSATPVDPPPDAASEHRQKLGAASAYLRLCRNHSRALKRLGRYETALWRQTTQTLLMLEIAGRNRLRISRVFGG
jgi:hypothetical protein